MRNTSLRLTGVIALALILMFAMTINTDTTFSQENIPQEKDLGTIEKPGPVAIDNEEDYAEGQALVMFRTPTKVSGTKKSRNRTLQILELDKNAFTIEDQWTFKTGKTLTTTGKGSRKLTDGTSSGYEGVALIKSDKYSTKKLISLLKKREDVKYAEPNYRVTARSITNDAYIRHQWSMGSGDNTPNISSIWAKTTGDEKAVVAILDTGVDYTHPDLEGNMWENDCYPTLKGDCGYDFINGDPDPMDDNGHGTHCAGIMGAVGNNEIGISGVNQKIGIMALKTLNSGGAAYLSHEIEAYNYIDIALDNKVPVRAINNSWGGGDYSDIFAELIDIVGDKGAVTVCAAGNDGADNDVEEDYPSCIDSPYLISVAATARSGKLAEYSNYGDETVDVAAPGSEILSTVPYSTYNPTIYDNEKQDKLSEHFNDFSENDDWGIPDNSVTEKGKIYLNGVPYDPSVSDQPEIDVHVDGEGEGFEDGSSLSIKISGMKEDDLAAITIPYEISKDLKLEPRFSVMAKASAPGGASDDFGGSLFGITEMDASITPSLENMEDKGLIGRYLDGESDTWDHFELICPADEDIEDILKDAEKYDPNDSEATDPLKRNVVILVYATKAGDYSVNIDDMGMSKQDLDSDERFEKYDYMSGTSMAAPYISGAIALKGIDLGETDPETIINNTVSMAKKTPQLKVNQRGAFDFSLPLDQDKLPPRIGKITVNTADKTLTINGSGLKPVSKIEIGPGEDSLKEAKIIGTPTDRSIIVKDEGWINNVETVKVTGYENRESIRRDVYMVRGKKGFSIMDDMLEDPSTAMTTDGAYIYWTDSESGNIMCMAFANNQGYSQPLCNVDPGSLFARGSRKTGTYGMLFGPDLVTTGGKLYTVVEYGLTQTAEGDDTEWMDVYKNGASSDYDDFLIDEEAVGETSIYSGEMRLIGTYENEDEETMVRNLGGLPEDLRKIEDWTMATYGGKIYFIGGYSHKKGEKGLTKAVKVYDPATKKWSNGPSLPEGRAGGKALQSGNKLIYTLGYSEGQKGVDVNEQKYPANLVFDGKSWKTSKLTDEKAIEPYVINETVTRGGKEYLASNASIGLTRDGIVYMGLPAFDLGDTFIYNSAKDDYIDTGYNFISRIDSQEMTGIVVGGTMYGFRDGDVFRIPIPSGLLTVKASRVKGGSIGGVGSYMPGETAKATVRSAKNYKIKTLKVNGKSVKLKKNQEHSTLTFANISEHKNVTATFQKYKAKVKVKKKGKGKITGAKTYIIGKKASIKVKAAKGYYIKSIKVDKKKIKVKKKATKKNFKFKVKKDCTVKVVFKKK